MKIVKTNYEKEMEIEDKFENFYNSSIWKRYIERIYSGKVEYLNIYKNEEMVARFMITKRRLLGFIKEIEIKYGGSINDEVDAETYVRIYENIKNYLISRFKSPNCIIKISENPFHVLIKRNKKTIKSLDKWQKKGTAIIDFEKADKILKNKRRRYLYKRGLKNGLKIEEIKEIDQLKNAHEIVKESKRRFGAKVLPFKKWVEIFQEVDPDHRHMKYFGAYVDGEMVAFQGLLLWKNTIIEFGLSDKKSARKRKIYANDFIQYWVIKNFMENFKYVDMAGYFLEEKEEKEKTLNNFKKKWATDIVEYHTNIKIPFHILLLKKLKNM